MLVIVVFPDQTHLLFLIKSQNYNGQLYVILATGSQNVGRLNRRLSEVGLIFFYVPLCRHIIGAITNVRPDHFFCCLSHRVNSGKFGHQVNSDTHLQTV